MQNYDQFQPGFEQSAVTSDWKEVDMTETYAEANARDKKLARQISDSGGAGWHNRPWPESDTKHTGMLPTLISKEDHRRSETCPRTTVLTPQTTSRIGQSPFDTTRSQPNNNITNQPCQQTGKRHTTQLRPLWSHESALSR